MLGYATVGTNDLLKAASFYDLVIPCIGGRRIFEVERGVYYGRDSFELGVLQPYDGRPASIGNGTMVALLAPSRNAVTETYTVALSLGAQSEGEPGLRGDPSMGFYGAYFRDPDGNKLCVFHIGQA